MKKQKICIIGDGLSGLTTALALKNLNLDIDIYYKKKNKKFADKRTTAISESNYKYLIKYLSPKNRSSFWSCKKINLFYEDQNKYSNFLNYEEKKNHLMHIVENKNFKNSLLATLKKQKNVNLINKEIKVVDQKDSFILTNKKIYYDLIILCLGSQADLYSIVKNNRSIVKDYKEIAITGSVQHKIRINNPSQYFLNEGPLAILPFKKKMFSFVWSVNKSFFADQEKEMKTLINKKLIKILGNKSKIKILNIQSFPIFLKLKTKYYKKNILILGEGLHSIHPIAGQGFNLVVRDIKKIEELISKNLQLGLALKNSFILKEFYDERNPENTLIGIGVDLTNEFFKKNKYMRNMKNNLLKNVGSFQSLKRITRYVSDKGIYF
jgi:2-octaprenyl-6-methoxyphenol hydroxylase